jgi:hypothetical protein
MVSVWYRLNKFWWKLMFCCSLQMCRLIFQRYVAMLKTSWLIHKESCGQDRSGSRAVMVCVPLQFSLTTEFMFIPSYPYILQWWSELPNWSAAVHLQCKVGLELTVGSTTIITQLQAQATITCYFAMWCGFGSSYVHFSMW